MNHFMRGFATELVKLSAFPQHERESTYDPASSARAIMKQTSGSSARTGLKSGSPVATAPAPRRPAPTPLTSPNAMVGYMGEGK